jgi:hypothetical protein
VYAGSSAGEKERGMSAFGDQIGVGGDSSVRWNVDVRDPREGNAVTTCDDRAIRLHQEGIAETPESKRGEFFTLSIKLPREREARDRFLKELVDAAQKPEDGRIRFRLPIERGNMDKASGAVDQILIGWPSRRWGVRSRAGGRSRKSSRAKSASR